jgi:hypothetical protein
MALSVYRRVFEEQGLIYDDYKILYAMQDYPLQEVIL